MRKLTALFVASTLAMVLRISLMPLRLPPPRQRMRSQ